MELNLLLNFIKGVLEMDKTQAIEHMKKGGQVFRITTRDRFFYKIEEGELLCRCNELGGWNLSVAPLRDTDEFHEAKEDYEYVNYERKVSRKPIQLSNLK